MIARLLTIVGLASLVAAGALAKGYLRANRGLRRAFAGLLVSAVGGLGIAFSTSAAAVWPLAVVMLGGIVFLIWSMHIENKPNNRDLA